MGAVDLCYNTLVCITCRCRTAGQLLRRPRLVRCKISGDAYRVGVLLGTSAPSVSVYWSCGPLLQDASVVQLHSIFKLNLIYKAVIQGAAACKLALHCSWGCPRRHASMPAMPVIAAAPRIWMAQSKCPKNLCSPLFIIALKDQNRLLRLTAEGSTLAKSKAA